VGINHYSRDEYESCQKSPQMKEFWDVKGAKRIEIVGLNDKRQITAVFCSKDF